MSLIDLILGVVAIIIGIIATILITKYYFLKSASKKDILDLKSIDEKAKESTDKLVQKVEEIGENNILTANVKLENLINSQFNRYLEAKKLDRNLLLRELEGNKIRTLYIIKQQEQKIEEKRLLTERIKILGFKRVAYGDWILPPKKIKNNKFFNEVNGVRNWVEKNLLQGIKEHDFVNSVVIVDLSNIYDEQKGEPKRAKKIIGGILKPADLISKDKLLSDISKNENICLKELIQIPFLDVLISQEHPEIAELIKKVNFEIVKDIRTKLNIQKVLVTDLKKINERDLEAILKKYNIKNAKNISNEIKKNVTLIGNYFNIDAEIAKNIKNQLNTEAKEVKT